MAPHNARDRRAALTLAIAIFAFSFAAWGAALAQKGDSLPAAAIVQPEFLSLQVENPLVVFVESASPALAPVRIEVCSPDGQVSSAVLQTTWTLRAGQNAFSIVVTPENLAGFIPGEEVILAVHMNGSTAAVETTALYSASAPAASAWGLAFKSSPVSVSTSADTPVGLTVANPKKKAKSGKVSLAFLSGSGQTVAKAQASASLPPGSSTVTVTVTAAVALQAKQSGAQQVRGTLKVGSSTRATATASASFGLTSTASGTPLSGGAPLTVAFSGSASGGTSPYSFDWSFGDGTPHDTAQNPSHTYTSPGSYSASLTVTDAGSNTAVAPPLAVAASSASNSTLSVIQTTLFTPRCTGCHGGSSPTAGMNLSAGKSYSNLVNVSSAMSPSMVRVKPFDPTNSFLVIRLSGGHESVSAADQQAIRDWIASGAPNN